MPQNAAAAASAAPDDNREKEPQVKPPPAGTDQEADSPPPQISGSIMFGLCGLFFLLLSPATAWAAGKDITHAALLDALALTASRMVVSLTMALLCAFPLAALAQRKTATGLSLRTALNYVARIPATGFLPIAALTLTSLSRHAIHHPATIITALTLSLLLPLTESLCNGLNAVPPDLKAVARQIGLSSWQRFWRLNVPCSMASLTRSIVQHVPMGWFLLLWAEIISHPESNGGLGPFILRAVANMNIPMIIFALLGMLLMIVCCEYLLFRPLLFWSSHFQPLKKGAGHELRTPAIFRRFLLIQLLHEWLSPLLLGLANLPFGRRPTARQAEPNTPHSHTLTVHITRLLCLILALALPIWWLATGALNAADCAALLTGAFVTLLRCALVLILTTAIWLPVATAIGLNRSFSARFIPAARMLAAFPTSLLFPLAALAIRSQPVPIQISISPMLILNTQWIIAFALIRAAGRFPSNLLTAARAMQVRGWLWWRVVMLPGLASSATKSIGTAFAETCGVAIAAEYLIDGQLPLSAGGIGSLIAAAIRNGNLPHAITGVLVMTAFLITIDRFLWRRLRDWSERRFGRTI